MIRPLPFILITDSLFPLQLFKKYQNLKQTFPNRKRNNNQLGIIILSLKNKITFKTNKQKAIQLKIAN